MSRQRTGKNFTASFYPGMRIPLNVHHSLNCTYAACTVQVIPLITYSVGIITEQLAEKCDIYVVALWSSCCLSDNGNNWV